MLQLMEKYKELYKLPNANVSIDVYKIIDDLDKS